MPDTVTRIGDYAFSGCANFTSLTFPAGLTSIGSGAFGSAALTEITIPASVTALGDSAFSHCRDLTAAYILGSIPALGSNTFYLCDKLVDVRLPDSLTEIGEAAFQACSRLTGITIPDAVTSIGKDAFYGCAALTSAELPAGLETLGERAFRECTALAEVTLHEGLTSIGKETFYGCTALTGIDVPEGVTGIGRSAFNGCTSLASVRIPEGVTGIGCYAFYECKALTSVTLPASLTGLQVTSSGSYTDLSEAFASCSALTDVTFSYRLGAIPNRTFLNCTKLADIWFYGTEEDWAALTVGESNGNLTGAAVHICGRLTVTEQPQQAALLPGETAVFHAAADGLPGAALYYRWQRKSLGGQWADCTEEAGCSTDTLTVPAALTDDCDQFRCVVSDGYGNSTATDPAFLFVSETAVTDGGACGPETAWTLDAGGRLTVCGTGATYDFDDYYVNGIHTTAVPWNAYKRSITSAVVKEGVTRIGSYAFNGIGGLTSVSFPQSLTELGSYLFYANSKLSSVSIPSGVTRIGEYAFHNCRNLAELILPESLTELGRNAFTSCDSLTSVRIPAGVRVLPMEVFSSCDSLTEVELPEGLTAINGYAFAHCTSLAGIRIPDSVTYIGAQAFSFCDSLTSLIFPDGLTTISEFMFYRSPGIVSVAIPGSVTRIDKGAFANTTVLADVYFYGTEAQWAAVSVGINNEDLQNAAVHCCTPLTVTAQPEDFTGPAGSTASFTAEARGEEPLGYQWWVKTPASPEFVSSGVTGPVYEVELTAARNGSRLYCEITDAVGKTRRTDTVTMTAAAALAITAQPTDYTGPAGSRARFTVAAEGDGLSYAWYVKNPGADGFVESALHTATYSAKLTEANSGRLLYCVVTDAYGSSVATETVSMTVG